MEKKELNSKEVKFRRGSANKKGKGGCKIEWMERIED